MTLFNLKSFINNKYHYTTNKKGYNQVLALHNAFKWLYDDLEQKDQLDFVENVDNLILDLCIKEHNEKFNNYNND